MTGNDRVLWGRHLELKRAIVSAYQRRRVKEAHALEKQLGELGRELLGRWQRPSRVAPPPERFTYRIPEVDGDTGQVLRYLVADQDGVRDPSPAGRELPENHGGRDWLRVIESSNYAREKASRTWHILGHTGRPSCPGCRKRKDLVYLEFRNWDEDARFKIPHVLAMCDETASKLLRRSRREIFGVTAVGRGVPWPCRVESADLPEIETMEVRAGKDSLRGRHPRTMANLIPNARGRKARTA